MKKFSSEWHENISDAQEYVAMNIDDIEKVNHQWNEISQHIEIGDIDNIPMIEAAKATLTEEQDASVRSMLEESTHVPYDEISEYVVVRQARVNELKDRIAEVSNKVSERQKKLIEQQALLETIAPSTREALGKVVELEVAKVKSHEQNGLLEELSQAEAELELAESLFENTGRAWPLPALADVNYEPSEDEIFTIDQFPNERETISENIAEKVTRKFESRLSDASEHLALLLKEKPGHIWTGDELGQAVYNDGSDETRNSGRISALISNYRKGKVPVMANEFGNDLILQRGKRQLFDAKSGKSVPNTIRVVWRLVDIETATNAQVITTLNSERTLRQSYGDWEPAGEAIVKAIISSDVNESLPTPPAQPQTSEEATESTTTVEKTDWKVEFTESVHETIEQLKELGIMDEPEVSWKLLRTRFPSSIVGTETARERAFKNKLIRRSEMDDSALVSIEKAILSIVQNCHPNVFRVSSRRKEAIGLVEGIVDGYLRQHQ